MGTLILKIGGSVITQKQTGKPKLNEKAILQIAKELKTFTKSFPNIKIILLHGAGSFGHPLVYKYKLLSKPLEKKQLLGFSETICATRKLANLLAEIFLLEKLPVAPIQASVFDFSNFNRIEQLLKKGFIPMLGGDMSLDKKNQAFVVSADKLMVLFAKKFSAKKLFFGTDVDGVYEKFPAPKNEKPVSFLDKKSLKDLLKKMNSKNNSYDVTGAMQGKLKEILQLSKKEIFIFNCSKPGNLIKVLSGKKEGTRIII